MDFIKLAAFLARATLVGIVAILLFGPAIWLFAIDWAITASRVEVEGALPPVAWEWRVTGAAVALAGAALRAYGLAGLYRTFAEASRDTPFSPASVRGFRRFARVELAMVPFGILQTAAFGLVLSLARDAGEATISIAFGTPEIGALFLALLLVFVGEIFVRARAAAEENESFL